jgi:quercetin dioxygenase-like cupin family protein
MTDLKSTLRILDVANLEARSRQYKEGTTKVLAGNDERPSERLRIHLNIFKAGTQVPLHWHLVEALYYVISGHAVLEDIEGRSYDIGPGSAIYYPPGIAGAHGWNFKEDVQLISVRATPDPEKNIQFSVDKSSKESTIELDYLLKRGGARFKSLY